MAKRTRLKGKGAAIFLGDDKPASHPTNKTLQQYTGTPVNTSKATFYLPVDLIDNLEDTWLSLRSKYKGRKVAKSEIAQIALQEIIKEWEQKQDDSILVKRLTSK